MSITEFLFGTQLIEMLQSLLAPQFNWVFAAITLLGDGTVLVGLSAVTYWCFDKPRGRLVTYVLLLGAYLNFFLKVLIPWPRPPVDLRIVGKGETAYGFPSGHTQDSTTFWTWITLDFRKRILGMVGAAVAVAVGISRIYLGLHYPAQVIGGWIIGLAVALLGMNILRHIPRRNEQIRTVPHILFAFSMLIPVATAIALGAASESIPWQTSGYLFGFALGVPVEDRYVHFSVNVSIARKILRLAIGAASTGLLVLALVPILPDIYPVPVFVNSMIRGLFVAAIAPAVFTLVERYRTYP